MRVAFAAGALCFSLHVIAVELPSQNAAPAAPAAASANAPGTTSASASATAAADAAAAKHAKRTACLAQAKTKKLLGAEKTAFLKSCIDAP